MKILNWIFIIIAIVCFGLLIATYFGFNPLGDGKRYLLYIGIFGSLIISNIIEKKIKRENNSHIENL